MGLILLQVGQGGIQLGSTFLDSLCSLSKPGKPPCDLFRESMHTGQCAVARTVLIDTEPNVVAAAKQHSRHSNKLWRYGTHSSFTLHSGSGNNWAWGFCENGPKSEEAVMNLIRREVEKCDTFSGFVSIQSLAGGTGGGVGAYMSEALRDEYPSSCTLSYCIWPLDGEISVQYYNALLSIAHLQEVTDGVVIVTNESLISTCKKAVNIQRPSFQDMNEVGARALASVLLPSYLCPWSASRNPKKNSSIAKGIYSSKSDISYDDRWGNVGSSGYQTLPNMLSILSSHPQYRMLTLRATPQMPAGLLRDTTYSWRSHLKQLKRMMYIESGGGREPTTYDGRASSKVDRCLANLLVLRGKGLSEADVSLFDDKALYPIWSVDPLSVATSSANLGEYDMFAGMLSNSYSAVAPVSHCLSKTFAMYSAKAFLYHYSRHGLEQDVFGTSFAMVQDIVAYYDAL